MDIAEYYQRYAETLLGVDDSIGGVIEALRKRGELESTLVIYMGDNGFAFGEHGLIDKRTAYEESMRVPMLARCLSYSRRHNHSKGSGRARHYADGSGCGGCHDPRSSGRPQHAHSADWLG
jgi:arylsulfatase A-like enzyme